MRFLRTLLLGGIFAILALFMSGQSHSETQLSPQFGKNKVHYKDFKWATLRTAHFTLYFYRGEEQLARNAEKMAERAYHYLSETLHYDFSERIPLIIYASSDDFQQTEIIDGFIGEGTGGATEVLKGRIVIPFLGSYRDFNHVLIHELVHAFQFDMLSEGGAPLSLLSNIAIPLWFIEGMAEYLSEYSNPLTDMWLRDAVYHDTLPAAKKIDDLEDIRVYRFGESLIAYINDRYGSDLLGDLLREIAKTESWDKALQNAADTSWETIYAEWLTIVNDTVASESLKMFPIIDQADLLIPHKKDDFALNILPAVSPDGKYVAFISDRDFYQTIYLASVETGEILKPLVAGERSGTYELLRFLNTSLAWSPDSRQIAFNAKAGGENAIYLLNIDSAEVVAKLTPDVANVSFLAWSPDGTQIAFTGIKHGQEDLFVISTATQALTQLTNDLYANRHPAWSPGGTKIAFTTDAGQFSDPDQLRFGPSNLALYDVQTHAVSLLTDTPENDFAPVWSPQGNFIAFISDQRGVCNLYILDANATDTASSSREGEHILQLTNVNTGIVGLTEDSPAITWARAKDILLFSGFSDQGWNIFSLTIPEKQYQEYLTTVRTDEEQAQPPYDQALDETIAKKDWAHDLAQRELPEIKDYKVRLSPDYIFGGGGGSEKGFILLARLGFSDMLANHHLRIGFNFTEIFDEADWLISYTNLAHRLSYEVFTYQFGDDLGTYAMKGADLDLDVERGVGVSLLWPFDKFRRVEVGIEGRMVSGMLETEGSDPIEEIDNRFFLTPSLAYVHDTTLYTGIGPLEGRRARLSIQPGIGSMTYLTLLADYRGYWHVTRRSTLAFRTTAGGSFGENAQIFELCHPTAFRGRNSDGEEHLLGSKIALGSIEYRFPLLPKINILRGNIFVDTALAWKDGVQLATTTDADLLRLQDLHFAYGAGIRVPIRSSYGLLMFRFDFAQTTDLSRHIGKRRLLFSIGSDF